MAGYFYTFSIRPKIQRKIVCCAHLARQFVHGEFLQGEPQKYLNLYSSCSAKKCDSLLVETDIFCHLGVSFCIAWNSFNFIEIKKQEHRGTVQQDFYSPMYSFLNLRSLCFCSRSTIFPRFGGSIVIFDGYWIKNIFTQIISYIKVFNWGKNTARQYSIFKLMFVIGYNNQFTVVPRY